MTRAQPWIARCRSCQAPIWWRVNPSGKRQPMDYDLVANGPTEMPHHATCPQATTWTPRPTRKAPADLPFEAGR